MLFLQENRLLGCIDRMQLRKLPGGRIVLLRVLVKKGLARQTLCQCTLAGVIG